MKALFTSTLLLCCVGALACASTSGDPSGRASWRFKKAVELYGEGKFERALEYSEWELLGHRMFSTEAHRNLHLALLRKLEMDVSAEALEDVLARTDAGEDISRMFASMTEKACNSLERNRRRSQGRGLIESFGPIRSRATESVARMTKAVTTFDLNRLGEPENIQVLQANDLATAWLAIDSIAMLKVHKERLEEVDPTAFPIPNCRWQRRQRTDPEEVEFPEPGRGSVQPGVRVGPIPSLRLPLNSTPRPADLLSR